jgi:hypothetical protein
MPTFNVSRSGAAWMAGTSPAKTPIGPVSLRFSRVTGLCKRRRRVSECRAAGRRSAKIPNFSKKSIWIDKKTLAESSLNPWYGRAGGDENFRETSIVSALACISFRRCFSSPARERLLATTSRVRAVLRLDAAPHGRQGCGEKAGMSRKCFCKIEKWTLQHPAPLER